jgi:hypothetical protein
MWEDECDSFFRCMWGSTCADWEHTWSTSNPGKWEKTWGVSPNTWYQSYEETKSATECDTETGEPAATPFIAGTIDCAVAGAAIAPTDGTESFTVSTAGDSYIWMIGGPFSNFETAEKIYFDIDIGEWAASVGDGQEASILRGTKNLALQYPDLVYVDNPLDLDRIYFYCAPGVKYISNVLPGGAPPKGPWRIQIDWTQATGETQYIRIYEQGNPVPFNSGSCVSAMTTEINALKHGNNGALINRHMWFDNFTMSLEPIETGF